MKKLMVGLIAAGLMASSWAAPWGEGQPKNKFSASNTLLIVCQKQSYPGGMNCTSPSDMGTTYTASLLAQAFIQYGCSKTTGAGVYYCSGSGLEGALLVYQFSSGDASTIVYIPSATQ